MPEISIRLIAIQCFTFVHLCVCSRHEVGRSRMRYSTAREWVSTQESKDSRETISGHVHPDIQDQHKHIAIEESLSSIQSHMKKHSGRIIVKEPQFAEDQEIPTLIGRAGLKQLHLDYLDLFTKRGMQAFTGPAKDEFLADCMRDVMHWLGHDTKTTPMQRMDFCEKFWKTQNGGEDFADEIKHMEDVAQKPCSDDRVGVTTSGLPPCNESPTSGSKSERTFASGEYDHGKPSGVASREYHEKPAGGGRYEDGGVTIDELNRAVPSGGSGSGSTVHSRGSVTTVGDPDTSGHWSHGESERTYPEQGLAGADSKSKFRPIGWKSGTYCPMRPLAVFVLVVTKLHF